MIFSRADFKAAAKRSMRSAKPHVMLVSLVYLLITGGLFRITFNFSNIPLSSSSGSISGSHGFHIYPSFFFGFFLIAMLIAFVFSLLTSVVEFGYYRYALNLSRGLPADISTLFDGFRRGGLKALGLIIVISLLTFLWSLLFIIPGIVASYRYSQAIFVLADNPEADIFYCISRSKQLTKGNKLELFVLDLSFLGWLLLVPFTLGILSLWLTPYIFVTKAFYFHALSGGVPNAETQDFKSGHREDPFDI